MQYQNSYQKKRLILFKIPDGLNTYCYISLYTNDFNVIILMHDIQYRTGIAWQNNCYNQPCYPKFYFASDMDWEYV
nr:hypothetical protein [uncultured Lachnoclostridium sp.]